jgi:hypothetical protein
MIFFFFFFGGVGTPLIEAARLGNGCVAVDTDTGSVWQWQEWIGGGVASILSGRKLKNGAFLRVCEAFFEEIFFFFFGGGVGTPLIEAARLGNGCVAVAVDTGSG